MTRARLSRSTLLLARVAGPRVAVRGKTEASRRPRPRGSIHLPLRSHSAALNRARSVPRWPEKRAQPERASLCATKPKPPEGTVRVALDLIHLPLPSHTPALNFASVAREARAGGAAPESERVTKMSIMSYNGAAIIGACPPAPVDAGRSRRALHATGPDLTTDLFRLCARGRCLP